MKRFSLLILILSIFVFNGCSIKTTYELNKNYYDENIGLIMIKKLNLEPETKTQKEWEKYFSDNHFNEVMAENKEYYNAMVYCVLHSKNHKE